MTEVSYEVTKRIARITLNRPQRGNGITRGLLTELERCVERADLDPAVHVLLLAGNGKGFCGRYDLVQSAEGQGTLEGQDDAQPGSPLDPVVMAANHNSAEVVNQSLYSQGLHATQILGTVFDGIARHTREGYAFQGLAAAEGFRAAVRQRDEPFATDPARHPGSPDRVVAKSSRGDYGR
jgi:hypothetical protein